MLLQLAAFEYELLSSKQIFLQMGSAELSLKPVTEVSMLT